VIAAPSDDTGNPNFVMNEKVVSCISKHITEEYAPFCATMHEKIAQFLFADVAQGLAYMHHPKILVANRDIKPENIVVTTEAGGTSLGKRDRAMIVDFTTAE